MIKLIANLNLGNDAQLNNVNGKQVINFNAAHSEKYKDQQGNVVDNTTWLNCSWWSEKTNILPYLKKGQQILVEGVPSVKSYTNKDGKDIPQLLLKITSVTLLGSKPQNNNSDETPF